MCQPIDVGMNKSIKSGMRDKWEHWMNEGDGNLNDAAKDPPRQLGAKWVLNVYKNFPDQMARNAWMKKG